jgi:uncharacterized membrane protein
MTVLATAAALIAGYLTVTRLLDVPSLCGPLAGCATVASSEWSTVAGIPVAAFGLAASTAVLAASLAWWLRAARVGLVSAYLVGLVSLPFLVWLTWMELFVIRAVCDWCVAYAVATVAGWLVAVVAMRRLSAERTA